MTTENLKEFISSLLVDSGFSPYSLDGEDLIYGFEGDKLVLQYKNRITHFPPVEYLYLDTLLKNIEWYQDEYLEDNPIQEEEPKYGVYIMGIDPYLGLERDSWDYIVREYMLRNGFTIICLG